MSTLLYAALTTRRDAAKPGSSTSTEPPGVKTYVDAFAALVPAEVLALHATIMAAVTKTIQSNGGSSVVITDADVLAWAFWGLLLLSAVLYVIPRWLSHALDKLDLMRGAIPPLALLGWMMLQRPTAIDALHFSAWSDAARTVIALFLGVVLGLAASSLAYKADQK